MKMRKLFAGLAAAATLLSGMAIGVAAAQADDAPLLQVNHAQEGHTYTPYKFAMFENPGDGSVEVKTVDAWKGAVTTAADVLMEATTASRQSTRIIQPPMWRRSLRISSVSSPRPWLGLLRRQDLMVLA